MLMEIVGLFVENGELKVSIEQIVTLMDCRCSGFVYE